MKALSIIQAGEARVIDVPEPQPAPGELLLKVEMVGLCGTDLSSFRGKNPLIEYPRIIGHEIAATVVQGSDKVPAGSRVTVSPYTNCGKCASCLRGRFNACEYNETLGVQRNGALTELIVVPEEKVYAAPLSFKELCLVEPLTVGTHGVARGRVTKDDTVVVFGCGGVGLGAISGAAFRGARVIAVDLDDAKLEIARTAGATELIHSGRDNFHERVSQLTNGLGPDVIIEAIGLPETFRSAVEEVAFSGRIVYIGYTKEPVAYETKLFVKKELDISGSRNALPDDFREVMAMLQTGRFPVESAVSAVIGINEVASTLEKWSASPGAFTKIMVQVAS